MADKSYGQFGTFKWGLVQNKNKSLDPVANLDLSPACQKDIKYFLENSNKESTKVLGYTWEKPNEESPTIFKRHEVDDKPEDDRYKNTLQLMEPYKGFPHAVEQNKWEDDRCAPPVMNPEPQTRRTAVLSTMTRFAEEMNLTFPGYKLY